MSNYTLASIKEAFRGFTHDDMALFVEAFIDYARILDEVYETAVRIGQLTILLINPC